MLAVNPTIKKAIFSMGKTGTSTLMSVLNDDWYKVGEGDAYFMKEIFKYPYAGYNNGYTDQVKSLDTLYVNDYHISFIIRDPWKRYVSGIKEIINDSTQPFPNGKQQEILRELFNNHDALVAYINRLFYLSEFPRQVNSFEWDPTFPHPSDFALHYNYHTRNWLHVFDKYIGYQTIHTEKLDNFISNLGYTIPERANVSEKSQTDAIDLALRDTGVWHYIQRYLEPEIERYQQFSR